MIVNKNVELLFIDYSPQYMKTVKVMLEQGRRLADEVIHLVHTPEAGIELLRERDGVEMIVLHTTADKKDIRKMLTKLRHSSLAMIMLISQLESCDDIAEFYGYGMNFFVPPIYPPEMAVAYFEALYDRHRLIPSISCMKATEHIKDNVKMQYGDLTIDPASHMVERDGLEINLTAKEYHLLYFMARNANILLAPELIHLNVWGSEDYSASNLSTWISRLRRKIELDPENPVHIITKYGQGYMFRAV